MIGTDTSLSSIPRMCDAQRDHINGEFWVDPGIKLETSDIGSVLLT